jgi:hypothetical protein
MLIHPIFNLDSFHSPLVALPPNIMRRVAALKLIQNNSEEIDVEYKKERILLETKYRLLKVPLLTSRDKIVSGEVDVPKTDADEGPG